MDKRQLRSHIYKEALEESLVGVEMDLSHLSHLRERQGTIAEDVLAHDQMRTILNLELSLARYGILLRKMKENNFLIYTHEIRDDINALIHSNRMDVEDNELCVYSSRGKQIVDLKALLAFGRTILKESK